MATETKSSVLRKVVLMVAVQRDGDWTKVMEVAFSVPGVESVSISRVSKSLVIIGKDTDPVGLVAKLRKRWHSQIVSVVPNKKNSDAMEVSYEERLKYKLKVKPNQRISDVTEIFLHGVSKSSEALATKFLERLDDLHETSHVCLQDFGSYTTSSFVQVGRWQVPSELEHYALKIFLTGGDEFGNSVKTGMIIQNLVFSTLSSAVGSMESTPMESVTELLLLKWRDAITDAMRLGFKVQFLRDHLLYLGEVFVGKSLLKMNENSEVEIAKRRLAMLQEEVASLNELIEKRSSEPISPVEADTSRKELY